MKRSVCAGDVPLQLHPLQQEQSYYSWCKACSNKTLEVQAHAAAVFVQQHEYRLQSSPLSDTAFCKAEV